MVTSVLRALVFCLQALCTSTQPTVPRLDYTGRGEEGRPSGPVWAACPLPLPASEDPSGAGTSPEGWDCTVVGTDSMSPHHQGQPGSLCHFKMRYSSVIGFYYLILFGLVMSRTETAMF